MKNGHRVLLFLTAAFVCILIGFYFGRNMIYGIRVSSFDNAARWEKASNSVNQGKIDINTANQAQLQLLPGIGETIAKNIIEYREKNGPFVAIIELMNVDGIGKARLNEILDWIYISN